jgi:uncharacterized protein
MPAPGYFEVHADDCERAKKFYGEVFGWGFTRNDVADIEYWFIDTHELGAMRGGLLRRPGTVQPMQAPNAYVVTLGVKLVDDTITAAVAAGAIVALPKWPIAGIGWQAYLIDTEKNVFGIHQGDPNAG